MKDHKRIMILGGGYGGVKAAKLLAGRAEKTKDMEIFLIDKKPYHTLMTELHEVAGGRVEPESVQIDLRKVFDARPVRVVTDEIKRIDFQGKALVSENEIYPYDYLIIGTGAEPAFFGIPGVAENGFTLWSMEDAMEIREHIIRMFEAAYVEKEAGKRRELLTFAVAGAGFTGIETAGELMEWRDTLCRQYLIDPREVRLIVVEAMCSILPILNEGLVKRAERFLKSQRVEVVTDAPITEVRDNAVILKDGREIGTRTLIWTCGIQGSDFAAKTGLTMGKRSRIQVNEYMQSMDYENVYVIGDNAYFEEADKSGTAKPIPQIVEAALQTAETAAHNIMADMEKKPKKPFKSNYHGIMVSIGSRYAVADLMGRSMSGFFAMAVKHLVNIHYQFEVGGVNRIWTYIKHEFLHIKANRSMLGGHLAARTPIFWLAILRVYLGVIWLLEGVKKVQEGWLDPANNFVAVMPKASDVPLNSTNAVTAATEVAQYYPEPILSKPPAAYQWFTERFIEPNAYLFQVMVVITEIAIGLALIAGIFTVLSALASIFLCGNFILSAMAGTEILWHIVAAVTMFGGAGRTFGLDYYVMPRLAHWWSRTRFARRTYLYFD